MGTRACRNFRNGAGAPASRWDSLGTRSIYLARICLFPMFCKCREFSKWIRDLCVLPERLASAHVYRKTAGHGEARDPAPPRPPPLARRPARVPAVAARAGVSRVSRLYSIPTYP